MDSVTSNEYAQALMLSMKDVSKNAIQSVEATYTYEAKIVNILDEGAGLYEVEYLGNIIKASNPNIDIVYEVGQMVYIIIPNGDMNKEKIILSPVSSTTTTYAITENGNSYIPLGTSLIAPLEMFKLYSHHNDNGDVIERIIDNSIPSKSLFKAALDDSRVFNLTCKIQTNIEKYRQNNGNYGLRLIIPVKKEIDGELKLDEFSVELNINNMTGTPYDFISPALQNVYFTFPEDMILDEDESRTIKIEGFVNNFLNRHPERREDTGYDKEDKISPDIFISDIQILSILEIEKENMSGYHSVVVSSQGNCFYNGENSSDEKTLSVTLYLNGKVTNISKFECYWFRENVSIDTNDSNFNKYGGLGWEILNEASQILPDENGKINYQYVTDKYFQKVTKATIHNETRYKCVLVKDKNIITSIITIKNLAKDTILNLVTSTGSNVYPANIGNVTLQLEYCEDGITNRVNTDNDLSQVTIGYSWQRLDKKGNYIDSNFYTINQANNPIMKEVEIKKEDGTLDKVMKSFFVTEIQFPVSKIEEANTIGCTVYLNYFDNEQNHQKQIIGTKWITITTKEFSNGQIIVTNGDKLYKYDADGDSPMVADYDGPASSAIKNIAPIFIRIFNENGIELTEDEYKTVKVDWLIPINSMISNPSSNYNKKEGISFDNNVLNLGYYTISGSYNKLKEFKYNILNTYNKNKSDNTIIIKANAPSAVLKEEIIGTANIRFLKDGEAGTNGSKYAAIIKYKGYEFEEKDSDGDINKLQLVCLHTDNENNEIDDENNEIDEWRLFDYKRRTFTTTADNGDLEEKLNVELYVDGEPISNEDLKNSKKYKIKWSVFDDDINLASSIDIDEDSKYVKVKTPFVSIKANENDNSIGQIKINKYNQIGKDSNGENIKIEINEEWNEIINIFKKPYSNNESIKNLIYFDNVYNGEINKYNYKKDQKPEEAVEDRHIYNELIDKESNVYDEDYVINLEKLRIKVADSYSIDKRYISHNFLFDNRDLFSIDENNIVNINVKELTNQIKKIIADELNWENNNQIYYFVAQAEVCIKAESSIDADEYLYVYYPIECSRVNKDDIVLNDENNDENIAILNAIPTMNSGFYKVLFASDGTNPQYDNTNPFVISNPLIEESDTYKYEWITTDHNLIIEKTNGTSCKITPTTKFDNGISKNYVAVTLNRNDNFIIDINNQIKFAYLYKNRKIKLREYFNTLKNNLEKINISENLEEIDELQNFCYNKYMQIMEKVAPLYLFKNNIITKIEYIEAALYDIEQKIDNSKIDNNNNIENLIINCENNIMKFEKYKEDIIEYLGIKEYYNINNEQIELLNFWQKQLEESYNSSKEEYNIDFNDMSTWTENMQKIYNIIISIKNMENKENNLQYSTYLQNKCLYYFNIENDFNIDILTLPTQKQKKNIFITLNELINTYNDLTNNFFIYLKENLCSDEECVLIKEEAEIIQLIEKIKTFIKNVNKNIEIEYEVQEKYPENEEDKNSYLEWLENNELKESFDKDNTLEDLILTEQVKYKNFREYFETLFDLEDNEEENNYNAYLTKSYRYNLFITNIINSIKDTLNWNIISNKNSYNNYINDLDIEIQNLENKIDILIKSKAKVPIIHIKPIIMLYNKYEMANLNGWDGNKLVINQESDYIIAPQIGAGVKEKDNSFTGIVMGVKRVTEKTSIKEKQLVGLFGYSGGTQSLFLNSRDGSAIFGKSGTGQIIIDPTATNSKGGIGLIYSSNYWKKYDYSGKPKSYTKSNKANAGMLIDLTTPEIRYGNGNFIVTKEGHITAKGGGRIGGWSINDTQIFSTKNGTQRLYLDSGQEPYIVSENVYLEFINYNDDYLTYINNEDISNDKKDKLKDKLKEVAKNALEKNRERKDYFIEISVLKTTKEDIETEKLEKTYEIIDDDGNVEYHYTHYGKIYTRDHNELKIPKNGFYLSNDGLSIGQNVYIDDEGRMCLGRGAVKNHDGKYHWVIDANTHDENVGYNEGDYSYIGYNTNARKFSVGKGTFNETGYINIDDSAEKQSIYLGTDGIRLGQQFAVDPEGNVLANFIVAKKGGDIAGWEITNTALATSEDLSNVSNNNENALLMTDSNSLSAAGSEAASGRPILRAKHGEEDTVTIDSNGSIYTRDLVSNPTKIGDKLGWCIDSNGSAYFQNVFCNGIGNIGGIGKNNWNFDLKSGSLNLGIPNLGAYNKNTHSATIEKGISIDYGENGATNLKIGGDIYAENGYFNGTIVAEKGYIGGWDIEPGQLSGGGTTWLRPDSIRADMIGALSSFWCKGFTFTPKTIQIGEGQSVTVLASSDVPIPV